MTRMLISSEAAAGPANIEVEREEIAALRAQNVQLEQQIASQRLEIEKLQWKLQDLLRRLFGPKSEKINPDQYPLLLEQFEADFALRAAPLPAAAANIVSEDSKPRKGGGRRPAPEHLPIERVEIDLPEAEKTDLVRIREEITEEIDYRPSQFIRRHYVRFVYADPQKAHAPRVAPLPMRVLPQASVGAGLLAHLLVSKYVDHLPLNRQEQIAARVGVDLPRQKLARWVEEAALLLRTIHEQLSERILESRYVQVDETPIKVLDPDRGGHAAQAYLWTYLSPTEHAIVFDFDLSRGRANLQSFFPTDWAGVLQSDGYEVYNSFLREKPDIVHMGCMAHLRRYVIEAADGGGEDVAALIADLGALYGVEKEARERVLTDAQRAQLRAERCPAIFERLHARFTHLRQTVLPQSPLGKAATYALNHWSKVTRYAQAGFGHVLIDNNSVERGIRPTKLGSKNWLFIGHPKAGWRSAVIYSITGTCKLLKVNPHSYLEWVLPRLAAATTTTARGLLPQDFAALNTS
jgi:transposase